MIGGLEAAGPFPGLEEEMALFGQFVGDWEIVEDRFIAGEHSGLVLKGELHWGWILGGRATQDVWIMRGEAGEKEIAGSTVRFYDSRTGDWQSIWIVPSRGEARSFRARREGESIILDGGGRETPERWIFYDIGRDEFRWRAEEQPAGDGKWVVTEVMQIRRFGGGASTGRAPDSL